MIILSMTFSGPLQIVISIFLLYDALGPSVFAGFGLLIVLVLTNGFTLNFFRRHQFRQMQLKDKRLKLTSEVMSGIKVLKVNKLEWVLTCKLKVKGVY